MLHLFILIHRESNTNKKTLHSCKNLQSQILSLLLTLRNPPLHQLRIPRLEPHLKRLRLRRQRRRNRITLNRVQNRPVCRVLCRVHRERHDQADVCGVQFAVGELRAGAHAGARAVAVVWGAGAFAEVEVALGEELLGVLEVGFVVVGGPGVLSFVSIEYVE